MPFLAMVLVRSSDLAASGSPLAITRRGRAPCSFHNTLEWVSSASCSEPRRLSSLPLNSFIHNNLCCALGLVSLIFLDCLFIAQECCSHVDYNGVTKPLYVYVVSYLMLWGCSKGFYQLEVCCSTSPLHSPSRA